MVVSQGRSVAVVLGSAGPVGAAIVARLSMAGFAVAGIDDSPGAGDEQYVVDATDRAELCRVVSQVQADLGSVSILVVAPHIYDSAPIGEMDRPRWERLLHAHLAVATNACVALVPAMCEAGSGTVVLVSSWLALAGIAGEAYQAAASGTLLSFCKGFAMEVAPAGVRVNCIAVGPGADPVVAPTLPLGRPATLEEVADTVVFLAQDGDFYVGQVFEPAAGAVV